MVGLYMPLISIPAHYDGSHVLLDEAINLPPNTRLIVTVLDDSDPDRAAFLGMSSCALNAAYSDEEVEYTENDLRK